MERNEENFEDFLNNLELPDDMKDETLQIMHFKNEIQKKLNKSKFLLMDGLCHMNSFVIHMGKIQDMVNRIEDNGEKSHQLLILINVLNLRLAAVIKLKEEIDRQYYS